MNDSNVKKWTYIYCQRKKNYGPTCIVVFRQLAFCLNEGKRGNVSVENWFCNGWFDGCFVLLSLFDARMLLEEIAFGRKRVVPLRI